MPKCALIDVSEVAEKNIPSHQPVATPCLDDPLIPPQDIDTKEELPAECAKLLVPSRRRNKFERFRPFFVFNSSNSNRILSSRELIIFTRFEFLVCLGFLCCVLWLVFTRGQTHSTDTAQHRDTQHSHIKVFFMWLCL